MSSIPSRFRGKATGCALALALAVLLDACSGSPAAPTTPTLKVVSISPSVGSTTGGTQVTVAGAEFGADAAISVGGVAGTKVVLQGTTSFTATLGARPAAGTADVVVTSAGKSAVLPAAFTFFAPTGSNQPPVISSVRSVGPRPNQPSGFANIDDAVTLVPVVVNAESSDVLTYEWSGSGTFASTTDGTTVWRVPSAVSPAPQAITATLGVTETFAEGAVSHTQLATPFGFLMQVHDSQREVLDMGEDFLTLFTRQVATEQVLHDFSPTCDASRGRSDEANDVDNNRRDFIEDFNAFRITRRAGFSINFRSFCGVPGKPPQPNTDACGSFSVHWEGIEKRSNARFVVNGIDFVSAVVENNQWRLCHSSFVGTESYPALGITRAVYWQ